MSPCAAELRQLLVSNAKNKEAVEAKCNGLQASLEQAQAHIDLLNKEKLEMAAHYQVPRPLSARPHHLYDRRVMRIIFQNP